MPRQIPMLFSTDMIRALLYRRKTETRRIFKDAPDDAQKFWRDSNPNQGFWWCCDAEGAIKPKHFGTRTQVGDLIWVKENYQLPAICNATKPSNVSRDSPIIFTASEPRTRDLDGDGKVIKVRPSIHMPKAFSRLTLRVTGFNIERLHEIDNTGAVAEGLEVVGSFPRPQYRDYSKTVVGTGVPWLSYKTLWNKLNGPDAWDQNPWVTVTQFEVLRANVEKVAA